MILRPRWQWIVCALVVVGFSVGALVSRAEESLPILSWVESLWEIFAVVYLLGLPCLGFIAFLLKDARRMILIFCAALAVTLALSGLTVHGFGFSRERALEILIERFEPVAAAVQRFEREQGRPPENLEQLVPTYLAAIPRGELLEHTGLMLDLSDRWCLWAEGDLSRGLRRDSGKIVYRPDGRYDEPRPDDKRRRHGRWGQYRGWFWFTWW